MADYSVDETISGSLMSDVNLSGLDNTKVTLAGENTVHTDSAITLQPVTTTSTVTVEPTNATVDLKPVAVDTCLRVELAPVPPTEVTLPYEQRWSVSLFGMEIVALAVRGRASSEIRPLPRRPIEFGAHEGGGCGCGCDGGSHDKSEHPVRRSPLVIEL